MPVTRLNHVVLYVRSVAATRAFYQEVFGFRELFGIEGQASFLQAPGSTNDHDLGIFEVGASAGDSEAGRRTVGMYHIACLLYTSPSPRDRTRSRMPSSA